MILYRPVDVNELRRVYESEMKGFPPRLPEQPIFYPVLNFQHASECTLPIKQVARSIAFARGN